MSYSYIDLSNGIKLSTTNDPAILMQARRVFVGENVTDEMLLAMLKGGIYLADQDCARPQEEMHGPLPEGAVCFCDLCGAALYPFDPSDHFQNVLNFRYYPDGCCHVAADGASSLIPGQPRKRET